MNSKQSYKNEIRILCERIKYLGGVAGRYAVGGRKSNKTILGTSIGAAAGALLGRATC